MPLLGAALLSMSCLLIRPLIALLAELHRVFPN
jgi:hypothetical protein